MKDSSKTKQTLIEELAELRSQNAGLKKSISANISAELAIAELHRYAESIVETIRQPLLVLDPDLKVMSANQDFYKIFKVTPGETLGNFIYDLGNKQWEIPKLRELLENILPEKEVCTNFEVSHDFEGIGQKIMLLNARQIYRKDIARKLILLVIEDITEHKRLENMLMESEERFRRLFETASDGIFLLEKKEGKITHANSATEKMLGYTHEESIGRQLQDVGIFIDIDDFKATMQNLNRNGIIHYNDVPVKTKSGRHIDTDIYLVDKAKLVQCNIRDITERKLAQDELRQSEAYFKAIIENSSDIVLILDKLGTITYASPSVERILGYRPDELIGKSSLKLIVSDDKPRAIADFGRALLIKEVLIPNVFRIRHKNGSARILEGFGKNLLDNPFVAGFVMNVRDITERKRAEETLKESEEKYRELVRYAPAGIYEVDYETNRFTSVNDIICDYTGYTRDELFTLNLFNLLTEESQMLMLARLEKLMAGEKLEPTAEYCIRTKDGNELWGLFNARYIYAAGKLKGATGVIYDITDRKQAERALKESESKYRLLADNANDVIFVLDMNLKYTYISPSVKILRGYEPEEVLKQPSVQTLTPSSWDLAIKTLSEVMELEKSERREIPLSRTLQLEMSRKDGTTVWTEVQLSFIRDEDQRPVGILGVTRDITDRKRSEEDLQRTLESLRKSFGATIQVMVSAVETRDPYTAGHQLRSADLARAIASEMGLSQEKIDGIRMAGSIHDIGKLSIPAEILSKPTKLTEIEVSLIKEHSRKGYEMLKDVESPWPLAEIVYQHHERMDGSGYPRNLKGDEILMEARILSVADVVEAMASHRPYRPGLGIDAALNEIEKNRGILYDDSVAVVCLRLFREKGFKLQTGSKEIEM